MLKRAFRSEIVLLVFFSQKILIDLKTNFTKFELAFYDLLFLRYNRLDFPLEKLFPLWNLPGLPIRNKISKIDCIFMVFYKYFAAELL